jgi:hypothetical protein
MARIFNICFNYKGSSYTALVYIMGNPEEDTHVSVAASEDSIRVQLPTGELAFPIEEVLKHACLPRQQDTLQITESIFLQLMNSG